MTELEFEAIMKQEFPELLRESYWMEQARKPSKNALFRRASIIFSTMVEANPRLLPALQAETLLLACRAARDNVTSVVNVRHRNYGA